ncbi:hypothetical protein D3C83_223480 [compost metagenome]
MGDGGWSRSGGLLASNEGEGVIYLRDRVVPSSVVDSVDANDTAIHAAVRRIKSFLLGK